MSHHNYRKLKTELTNQRNIRNINIAQTIIPLSKTDRVSVNAVMHKSLNGNILIGLNKSNMPTQAWRDIDGILPIRSKLIKSDKIRSVVASIRPRHLYLNDGELLRPISTLDIGQLHLYTDKTLMDVLHDIKMDALATLIPTTSPSPSSSYITKVLTPLSNFHLPSTSVEIVLNGDGYDNGSGGSSGDGDGGNNDTDVAKSLQKISPEESLPTLLTTSQLSLPVQSRASSSPSVDIISQNLTIPNVICHTKTVDDDDGNGHCRCSSNGTTNNKIDEKRKSKVDLEHTEPSNDEKQQDRPPTYKDFCIMQPNLTKREYNAFCKQFHRQLAIREKQQQQQKQQQQRRQSNNNTVGAKSNLRIKKNNL